MSIAQNLKSLLASRNMTMKELSEKSGVSVNTIYGIISKDRKSITHEIDSKLSTVLGVSSLKDYSYDISNEILKHVFELIDEYKSIDINKSIEKYEWLAYLSNYEIKINSKGEIVSYNNPLPENDNEYVVFQISHVFEGLNNDKYYLKIYSASSRLNSLGRSEAIKRILELLQIPKYTENDN